MGVGLRGRFHFLEHPWQDSYPDVKHPLLNDFKGDCATAIETRKVPCISLEHVIGNWLGGRDIWFLKAKCAKNVCMLRSTSTDLPATIFSQQLEPCFLRGL